MVAGPIWEAEAEGSHEQEVQDQPEQDRKLHCKNKTKITIIDLLAQRYTASQPYIFNSAVSYTILFIQPIHSQHVLWLEWLAKSYEGAISEMRTTDSLFSVIKIWICVWGRRKSKNELPKMETSLANFRNRKTSTAAV